MTMELQDRLAGLTPEKRRLLEVRLRMGRAEADGPAPGARPADGALPLSFVQQRLWVLDRLHPGTAAYTLLRAFRLRGALDPAALERALDALRERHEPLRTTFAEGADGSPVQVVHPFVPQPLPVEDLSAVPATERGAEAVRRVEREAAAGFDLVAGPLFRARLLRLDRDEHVLLLALHHAVADGWSLGVLARELGALYAALRAGRPAALPPLPLQYADYARWQREHLTDEALAEDAAFWRAALAGAPPALELPTDRPRPPAASHRGRVARGRIEPALAARVRALARDEGTTPFVVLLAALRVVLSRWSGQEDVVIGAPVAGRARREVEGLVGCFVNTLPLRGTVRPDERFRALLRREAAAAVAAFDHQRLPFERIVEELRIPRDLGRNPLFQVSLMLLSAPGDVPRLDGLDVARMEAETAGARFDLAFDLYEEEDGGLRVEAEYATDLFDAGTVARLVAHLERVLAQASARPDARVADLRLLAEAERAEALHRGRGPAREWPFVPVHRLFLEQAARTPHAVAVEGADGALTYAQLDALSAGIARALRARGAGRGSVVAVCADRSARMAAALLGVLRAGAAYLPLDPDHPAERLAYTLDDAGARILLTERKVEGAVPAMHVERVFLDDVAPADRPDADGEVAAEDLAYVIYTSGSTGRPKGVMVPHGGAAAFLRAMAETPGLRADETVLALTTLAFDIHVLELFLPLSLGARAVVATREQAADPARLAALLDSSGAALVQATPATWAMLLGSGWTPRPGTRLLSGGEALPRATADALLAAGAELWNLYGPTETTVWTTAAPVPAEGTIPLGEPIAGTTLYLLEPSGEPAPPGVPGELYAGGAGVARGYLGRPALTAERFLPDPFGAPGSRLYRTGDRARRRADGALEFLGRVDFQVKLRGFRIELGEVEAALRAHPAVGGAVALVRADAGDPRLAAYVVARNGGGPPAGAALRAFLRERLPEYMVPSAFVALDAFPLTPTGKVDRRALPAPDARAEERPFAAPRTPGERALAEIWREVLRRERVGLDDDFFDLGGHSILAAQVLARVRRALGVELPLRALFEAPTPRALAERLDRAAAAGLPPLVPAGRGARAPLSFAQERMWFLQRMSPGSGAYNMAEALALEGPLGAEALRRAFQALLARHEVLRTRYLEVDGQPVQEVLPPPPFSLPVEDAAEGEVHARMLADARAPFDLAAGPPVRARLLRIAPERHVLLLNVHHIAGDGWSRGVMLRELSHLYRAFVRGEEPALPPLPVQYADYALWQRAWLAGAETERQRAYWRGRLAGAPALLELPYDRPRPGEPDQRGDAHHFAVAPELARAARELARREGATLYMVLLAAFDAVLHRWSGRDDLVVGSPVAGRAVPEVEGLAGLFVNSLVMRADLSGDPSFRELLARVREAALEAHAHQDVPFEELVQDLGVERSLGHAPVFQVLFGLQNVPEGRLALEGVRVRPLPEQLGTSRLDLSVVLEEDGGGLRGLAEYATALWDAGTIERMLDQLQLLLRAAVRAPETPVSALPLLDEAGREAVLALGRGEEMAPARVPVHALFEAQAARAPGATALAWSGGEMAYGALDALASGLARRLLAAGVRSGDPVAVVAEHSPAAVAAMLGVMKAGGAYLPLDPALPAERLGWMLADARAAAVLAGPGLERRLPSTALPVLPLGNDPIGTEADTPLPEVDPRSLAYVLYTSGSTGTPKGVAVPHAALAAHLASAARRYGLTAADRVLAFASLGFDPSLEQVLAPLAAGASVALRGAEAWSAGELAEAVERMGITVVNPPTAYWHGLVEDARAAERVKRAARLVIAGGEAMRPDAAERWCALPGDAVLLNAYGPTEAVVTAAAAEVTPGARPAIGAPLPGRVLRVLDARMQPVPVGVPGELYAGGDALARGYLHRPALTAAAFVPDPFGAPGSRLYRTGDRARWLAAGGLEYLGRADAQVKVRGFRVEPGEVEAAVNAHPAVREAAVAVRGEGAERRLAAYVVFAAGVAVTVEALRADLAARLPEYLVPSDWVVLEALPLTPTGKVDRRALPAPAADERPAAPGDEAPRGPVEELLAGIWAELLGGRRVRRTDSFFALGGHSLAATRLMSRVARVLGVELPLRAVFASPTLAGLAEQVEAARAAADGVQRVPPIVPLPAEAEPPLSFAQERMWFLDRFAGEAGAYNVPVVLELAGALDVEALRGALDDLLARHAALRTRIAERDGRPAAAVAGPAPFVLPAVEVAEQDLDARLDREAHRPFDLARDLPVRGALFRTGPEAHVLALTFHHVAVDGWSVGILLRELAALYAARRDGAGDPLPPLPLRYADYAAWQRGWLQGSALERQTAYWKRALAGVPGVLELPADRPRPARQSFRGAVHEFAIPGKTVERIRALAAAEQVTPFMATLAVFQALLGRYAGQDDVVVGSPIAGRHRPESEPIVGLFVNTLALRADLSGGPTFRELLGRVRETTLDAYAHQDLPFERLVDELQVERKLDRAPLFQVVFSLQAAAAPPALPGVEVRERHAARGTAKFDLVLVLEEREGGMAGVLEYATDLFDAATAERLGGHYLRLLDQALAHPDLPVRALDPVTDAERQWIAAWNAAAAHPEHLRLPPVHLQAAAQAARTPDRVVLSWEGGRMTFAEVEARANRLAHHLIGLGVRPGSRVAICMERAPEMMVSILAAVKAGAAYVPIDPDYPAERIAWLLEDGAAPVLLTLARLVPSLPATAARVVAVDAEWDRIARASAEPPAIEVHPESTAYVIYTSGSTGRPKGVEIPHRALTNHMAWIRRAYPLGGDGVLLHKSPFGFDVSIWEFWQPLLEGGRLVLARPGGHRDPAYLLDLIRREGVTFVQFVPSMLAVVADEPGLEACTSLRRIAGAGEALPTEIVRRLRARLDAQVLNLYGPAEAAIHTSTHVCEPDYPLPGASIGRPVDNAAVYLVDSALRPVPRGAAGELCVGGAGVGTGYINRPALTAERFVPDPFGGVPGARMYRVGDRARLAADGTLQYLGRLDFQVKVRGNRVELGEVEAALLRDPSVREAVAVVRGDALAAYVTAAEGRTVDPAALRAALRRELPEFMVPAAVVALDALPLTPNGKVDRRALPDPRLPDTGDAHEAPVTETERALAAIWEELLPGRGVGREDGFFAIGGHSLLAMQLLARIRRAFAADVPIRAVFEAPSLRELAARIDEARAAADERAAEEIVPADRSGPLPPSFAQERMWFLDRLLPGTAVYNVPSRVRLDGALCPEALRLALEDLVRRHESLRTVFPARDGRPVQVVVPPAPFDLPLTDLSVLPAELAEREAERLSAEHARLPFDLAAGPLFRSALVRLAAERWMLLLNLHHVVADGWSLEIVFRELAELYAARAEGGEPSEPPAALQYPDYAAWQRRWLSGERLDRQVRWWRERLAGAPVLELPADRPRPATAHFRGGQVELRLPPAAARGVDALARAEGATPFQVLLGAFAVLLSRWSGQDDVVVGSPIAGRGWPETERMVGLFVNTLALRTDLSGDPAFREVVRRVREATLGAFAHQDVPFERLVDELKVERSLSRHPLFQVSFTYQQPAAEVARFGPVAARVEPVETGTAKFDLLLQVEPADEGLLATFEYAAELFDRGTAERMAGHFGALLDSLLADPDRPLSRASGLLRGQERRRVLEEWSGTDRPYPPRPVHEIVAGHAARAPEAPALSFLGRTMTYAELDRAANRLAHHLTARGVGPESIVAVLAERRPETVVAILAAVKAGGAYVPLDPAHPAERLRYMLADSGARTVVSAGPLPAGLAIAPADLLDLHAEAEAIAARPDTAPCVRVDPAQVAYVLYTSGSTGRPKGVAVTHLGVPNLALMQCLRMGVHPGDRVLQFASFSFDVSAMEVFTTLGMGATLVMAPREALLPGEPLLETLRRERITVGLLPPSSLPVMGPEGLPDLRVVLAGGEALSVAAAARWADVKEVHNVYGPTECTVVSTSARVRADGRRPSIGRPLENLRAYVLDAAGQPVPAGVPGELYVGGIGLARGYLNRPALTAERFVPDPFGAPGGRLYRTGDRVRWLPDGALDYLGRMDEQVKVRGFRIELGEISTRLAEVPGVKDALVLVRPDARGDARLVAWVAAPDRPPSSSELREHLRRVLPDYMVPQAFVVMDAFPQTPHGKVDRAALPAPADPAAEPAAAPQGELEQAIAAVWREVLGVEAVGVNDSFFEVGGHSLLVARLQEALRAALDRPVSMIDLFQYPTIASLAAHLDASARAGEAEGAEKQAGRGRGAARRELLKRGRR